MTEPRRAVSVRPTRAARVRPQRAPSGSPWRRHPAGAPRGGRCRGEAGARRPGTDTVHLTSSVLAPDLTGPTDAVGRPRAPHGAMPVDTVAPALADHIAGPDARWMVAAQEHRARLVRSTGKKSWICDRNGKTHRAHKPTLPHERCPSSAVYLPCAKFCPSCPCAELSHRPNLP